MNFVHVTKLNDPFDPYLFFETDFDERYELILDYVSKRLPNEFSWFIKNNTPELWSKRISDIRTYLQAQRQSTFMLSFIEAARGRHPKDNLLMWAHYGNGHRGILIEFDVELLRASAFAANNTASQPVGNPDEALLKVMYRTVLKPITIENVVDFYRQPDKDPAQTRFIQYFRDSIATKSEEWNYENEWRMLWRNDETNAAIQRMRLLDDSIVCVYIGMSASDGFRKEVISKTNLQFPKANVFVAEKSRGEFALKFRNA